MKVYIVWGSWAGGPPDLYKIFLRKSDAQEFQDTLAYEDALRNGYWVEEEDVINDSSG